METHGESGQPEKGRIGQLVLAEIVSVPMVRFDGQEGQFELEVHSSLEEILSSGDPWGYVKHLIAQHLAICVKTAGIPLGEKAWMVKFGPFIQANFNCPPTAIY